MSKPGPKPDPSKPYSKHKPKTGRKFATDTHCANAHTFTPENTYTYPTGKKVCKVCRMNANRKYKGLLPLERETIGVWNKDKTHCRWGHAYAENGFIKPSEGSRGCRLCTRENRLMTVYGLERGEYDQMFAGQNGACAICKEALVEGNLSVDHNHTTGEKRGLLCNNCNNGLGRFKDDPARLQAAVDYLVQYIV